MAISRRTAKARAIAITMAQKQSQNRILIGLVTLAFMLLANMSIHLL